MFSVMKTEQAFLALADAIKKHGTPICQETDPELWFPETGGENGAFKTAKLFCSQCPVRLECLNLALANNEQHGIWGGLSVKERQRLRR
jgi:WhiB family redox-sensing transcriptional regulator